MALFYNSSDYLFSTATNLPPAVTVKRVFGSFFCCFQPYPLKIDRNGWIWFETNYAKFFANLFYQFSEISVYFLYH